MTQIKRKADFESLVGRSISVVLKDGSVISGEMTDARFAVIEVKTANGYSNIPYADIDHADL